MSGIHKRNQAPPSTAKPERDLSRIEIRMSIVVLIQSHVMLTRMVACGASQRGFGAHEYKTAHETLPTDRFVTLPYCAVLDLLMQAVEAAFMTLFPVSYTHLRHIVDVVHGLVHCGIGVEVLSEFNTY